MKRRQKREPRKYTEQERLEHEQYVYYGTTGDIHDKTLVLDWSMGRRDATGFQKIRYFLRPKLKGE